jgi:enoyl-CoA hydratase
LSLTIKDHVAEVIFIRPELLNRFDYDSHKEFCEVLDEVGNSDIRAVIVGANGKVFSAGGDFDFVLQGHNDPMFLAENIELGRRLLMRLYDVRCPVIAAVQGAAIGLGATVALSCDMVVAARLARFADPHVELGLVAGDGGCLAWPMAAGITVAKRYLLTGDRMTADQALQFGLITDVVPEPEDVMPAARALALRIASLPPVAVQGTKRALNNIVRHRAAEVIDLAFMYEAQSMRSDDVVEAVAAAKEARPGIYLGR